MSYADMMQAAHKALTQGRKDVARKIIVAAQQAERSRITSGGLPMADGPALFEGGQNEDKFGDTIKAATAGPLAATKHYGAQALDPERSRFQHMGDLAMTGLNALGTGAAFGAGLAGEALGGSPTGERQLTRDLLIAGQVAVPEAAGVSSVGLSASRGMAQAAKPIPAPRTAIEAGKRAADDLGITPSLGAGGKIRAQTAATLEKVPLAGDAIAKDAVRFVNEIETAAAKAKGKVGNASVPSEAGATLQGGLNRYIERSKAKTDELYDEVAKALPPQTAVKLDNTTQVLDGVKQHFTDNPELAKKLGLGEWDAVIAEANKNGINWQAVRQLRTEIGRAIGGGKGTLKDESRARLDQLYGALTKDMEATALASGPNAKTAWERANNYNKNFHQRVETALDKTIKADSPERAFEAFANMARNDAASADVTRMLKIKASLKPSEWNDISASIVERLGKPTASAQDSYGNGFSPGRFLTQWNTMSTEAKRMLLPEDVRVELQKLADVAATAREANLERNMSNTGNLVASTAIGVNALQSWTALFGTAAAVGGVWGSTKAMTSPVFLRALNRAGRGDLKQLEAMASGKGAFTQDARAVLQILGAEAAATSGANTNARPLQQAQ